MNNTIKMSLFTIAVLILSACNNNKKQETGKQQEDTVTVNNTVPADETKNTAPASGQIALNQLPPNIQEFVTKNYAGYTMQNAAHDPLCSGADAIDVDIIKNGSTNYSLIFLPNGTFVQQEEDVDISKAPATVLKTIKEKYTGYTSAKQIERLTLADKTTQFLFDISKGSSMKEVILKEDGGLVCETKE